MSLPLIDLWAHLKAYHGHVGTLISCWEISRFSMHISKGVISSGLHGDHPQNGRRNPHPCIGRLRQSILDHLGICSCLYPTAMSLS